MDNKKIVSSAIIKSKTKPHESAETVIGEALAKASCSLSDIGYSIGTGYGREKIGFVTETMSEISCHSKGAKWLIPSAHTVIDIGGQDCKVMKLDQNANVTKFLTNDKCASGTGRFLDVMAKVLNIGIDELGHLSSKTSQPFNFSSTCTVWTQADVIKHINDGKPIEDIGAGINNAIANRVAMLVHSINPERDVCMTGGVAKNDGVVKTLSQIIGHPIKVVKKVDPQLVGAVGAALFALQKLFR